jgi:hypothetical protein
MIDNVSIKQRIEQFDLKHGAEDAIKSADGVFWLFPDGARRETRQPFGLLDEPPNPDNEYELRRLRLSREDVELQLLERQREYHATRLAQLTQEFKNKKEVMLGGHYGDGELSELNKLAKTVHVCRHELSGIEEEIRRVSPYHKAVEMDAYAKQQRQQRIEAVRSINI